MPSYSHSKKTDSNGKRASSPYSYAACRLCDKAGCILNDLQVSFNCYISTII